MQRLAPLPARRHALRAAVFFAALVAALVPSGARAQSDEAPAAVSVPSFAPVAERVSRSVVSIDVESRHRMPIMPLHLFGGPKLDPPQILSQSRGSGVVLRADGYVLTNHHVVDGAAAIRVRVPDGRAFPAQVVGTDPLTDLAVLRVDAADLVPVRFAAAEDVRVGEWVLAVGAPYGLDASVTTGVVSAIGRSGMRNADTDDFIQTDASIHPGNSGGPLVNARGEVIGINTMVLGLGGGIGFAVSADTARHVASQIIDRGRVERSWLGVRAQELTPELAAEIATAGTRGALIAEVVPNSPAARAGIRPGDVVRQVDDRPIASARDLVRSVQWRPVGAVLRLRITRDGREHERTVTTAAHPSMRPVSLDDRAPERGSSQLAFATSARGEVVVSAIETALGDGLRIGDVVLEADRRRVRTADDVHRALRDGSALLRIRRDGTGMFVVVRRG